MFDIRKAIKEDASIALKIRKESILYHCIGSYPIEVLTIWAQGDITERFISDLESKFYVAANEKEVIGTGMLNLISGQIDAVFVSPQYMKMGVATKIMGFLEELGKKNNLTKLTLDSTINAAGFYRRLGFIGDCQSIYKSPKGFNLACIPMVKIL
jgi:GNAT superfamily N-acetyltransferase